MVTQLPRIKSGSENFRKRDPSLRSCWCLCCDRRDMHIKDTYLVLRSCPLAFPEGFLRRLFLRPALSSFALEGPTFLFFQILLRTFVMTAHLNPRGDIAIAEIIAYVPILIACGFLIARDGFAIGKGWCYLIVLSVSEYPVTFQATPRLPSALWQPTSSEAGSRSPLKKTSLTQL